MIWLAQLLALAAIALAAPGRCLAADWSLRVDGIGPLRVGMRIQQMNEVLGEHFSYPPAPDDQGCFYLSPSKEPRVGLMVENGILVRVDVLERGVRTANGVQVGDAVAKVRGLYGKRLETEPHAYSPEEKYLTVRSADNRHAVRFETDRGKVRVIYSGFYKQVQYIEGCQ